MKKFKVAAIVCVFVGIFIFSVNKVSEKSKEVDFNYPYLVYSENKDALTEYKVWFPDSINLAWETNEFILTEPDMISYQEAANIAAYTLKELYGINEQSYHHGAIQLYNHVVYNKLPSDAELGNKADIGYDQPHRYVYMFTASGGNRYVVYIDRYNKTVFNVFYRDSYTISALPDKVPLAENEIQRADKEINKYLQLLNVNKEISKTDITAKKYSDGHIEYTAYVYFTDNYIATVLLQPLENESFQFISFKLGYFQ